MSELVDILGQKLGDRRATPETLKPILEDLATNPDQIRVFLTEMEVPNAANRAEEIAQEAMQYAEKPALEQTDINYLTGLDTEADLAASTEIAEASEAIGDLTTGLEDPLFEVGTQGIPTEEQPAEEAPLEIPAEKPEDATDPYSKLLDAELPVPSTTPESAAIDEGDIPFPEEEIQGADIPEENLAVNAEGDLYDVTGGDEPTGSYGKKLEEMAAAGDYQGIFDAVDKREAETGRLEYTDILAQTELPSEKEKAAIRDSVKAGKSGPSNTISITEPEQELYGEVLPRSIPATSPARDTETGEPGKGSEMFPSVYRQVYQKDLKEIPETHVGATRTGKERIGYKEPLPGQKELLTDVVSKLRGQVGEGEEGASKYQSLLDRLPKSSIDDILKRYDQDLTAIQKREMRNALIEGLGGIGTAIAGFATGTPASQYYKPKTPSMEGRRKAATDRMKTAASQTERETKNILDAISKLKKIDADSADRLLEIYKTTSKVPEFQEERLGETGIKTEQISPAEIKRQEERESAKLARARAMAPVQQAEKVGDTEKIVERPEDRQAVNKIMRFINQKAMPDWDNMTIPERKIVLEDAFNSVLGRQNVDPRAIVAMKKFLQNEKALNTYLAKPYYALGERLLDIVSDAIFERVEKTGRRETRVTEKKGSREPGDMKLPDKPAEEKPEERELPPDLPPKIPERGVITFDGKPTGYFLRGDTIYIGGKKIPLNSEEGRELARTAKQL